MGNLKSIAKTQNSKTQIAPGLKAEKMLRQALLRGCWRSSKLENFARKIFCGERREFWRNFITHWVIGVLAPFGGKKPRRSWKSQGRRKIWRWLFFLGACLHEWKSRRKRPEKVHTLPWVVQKSKAMAVFLPVKWLHKQVKRWMIRAGLSFFPNQKE